MAGLPGDLAAPAPCRRTHLRRYLSHSHGPCFPAGNQEDPQLAVACPSLNQGSQRLLIWRRITPGAKPTQASEGFPGPALRQWDARRRAAFATRSPAPDRPEPRDHLAALLYQSGNRQKLHDCGRRRFRWTQYALPIANLGSVYQAQGRLDKPPRNSAKRSGSSPI
jgi:hypothetical protein